MLVIVNNRKGFTYVVAIGILGLLAFMGLFLMQSSSVEYSQTSISVYRTMGRQLAEAAAEEACVMLEERFKDKSSNGFFQHLMLQASKSGSLKMGGSTGLNPVPLNDFTDLHKRVTQTIALRDYHVSRAGFNIEKILPTIKDLRPISNGVADAPENYYRPTDRATPFDGDFSKSWYCTLQVDVTLSLGKAQKTTINYQISKDIKLLNLSPIARSYTFFSILGVPIVGTDEASIQASIKNSLNMNSGEGRLILWNLPFQSRVYMHGPAIINLENPNLSNPDAKTSGEARNFGAHQIPGGPATGPGPNHAFQYSHTLFGFSYFPTLSRGLFPSKSVFGRIAAFFGGGSDKVEDTALLDKDYSRGNLPKVATTIGGLLPPKDQGIFSGLKEMFSEGLTDQFFTGTNVKQYFLPAGPYCRSPWRYTAPSPDKSQPQWNNIKEAEQMSFPEPDDLIRLEHAWDPNDDEVIENTKIYSMVHGLRYNHLTNNVTRAPDQESTAEFGLNYYNQPDPEGILSKFGATFETIAGKIWNVVTLPVQGISLGVKSLWNMFRPGKDVHVDASEVNAFPNLLPSNFMFNYMGTVTRRLKDENDIPRDSNGRWILNGVYMLDSLTVEAPVVYTGTGTLVIKKQANGEPVKIKGDVFCARDSNGKPLGHLNIFYHPYEGPLTNPDLWTSHMLTIENNTGKGVTVEASIYSCYGVRSVCADGYNIENFPQDIGADPSQPIDKWENNFLSKVQEKCNMILGNTVNYYTNLINLGNDLWVVHNYTNPLFFEDQGNETYILIEEVVDADENKRKNYEYGAHEFFMSPKIQHIGIKGAL